MVIDVTLNHDKIIELIAKEMELEFNIDYLRSTLDGFRSSLVYFYRCEYRFHRKPEDRKGFTLKLSFNDADYRKVHRSIKVKEDGELDTVKLQKKIDELKDLKAKDDEHRRRKQQRQQDQRQQKEKLIGELKAQGFEFKHGLAEFPGLENSFVLYVDMEAGIEFSCSGITAKQARAIVEVLKSKRGR